MPYRNDMGTAERCTTYAECPVLCLTPEMHSAAIPGQPLTDLEGRAGLSAGKN